MHTLFIRACVNWQSQQLVRALHLPFPPKRAAAASGPILSISAAAIFVPSDTFRRHPWLAHAVCASFLQHSHSPCDVSCLIEGSQTFAEPCAARVDKESMPELDRTHKKPIPPMKPHTNPKQDPKSMDHFSFASPSVPANRMLWLQKWTLYGNGALFFYPGRLSRQGWGEF